MATEVREYHLRIDADPRLAAAAGGAVRYLADAAGLETQDVANLQAATLAACQETFEALTPPHQSVDVTISRYPDRLEIALSYSGEGTPAVGLDTVAGFASQGGGAFSGSALHSVDRVQYETQGACAITRLTKYIPHSTSNA